MIPYEELVSALAHWRARNGLPTEADGVLGASTPSVTAALPLTGGEIVDLEEAGAVEEIEAYDDDVESAVAGLGDEAEDAYAGAADDAASYDEAAGYGDEAAGYGDEAAGYGDEAAGYGEVEVDAADAVIDAEDAVVHAEQAVVDAGDAGAVVEVDEGFEVEAVAADGDDFEGFEGEPTAYAEMPAGLEPESTRVGEAPDFADGNDPERSE